MHLFNNKTMKNCKNIFNFFLFDISADSLRFSRIENIRNIFNPNSEYLCQDKFFQVVFCYKVNGTDIEEKLHPIMGKVIKLWKKLDFSNNQLIDNENITKKVIETKRSYYQKVT